MSVANYRAATNYVRCVLATLSRFLLICRCSSHVVYVTITTFTLENLMSYLKTDITVNIKANRLHDNTLKTAVHHNLESVTCRQSEIKNVRSLPKIQNLRFLTFVK